MPADPFPAAVRHVVGRQKLLRELRHLIRDDAVAAGRWRDVKDAIDATTVGEHEGVVLFERDRRGRYNGLVVVGYRETLGDAPRVRVAPRLSVALATPPEPYPGQPLWSEAVVEVSSRVEEVRLGARDAGSGPVEVTVVGTGRLADDMRQAIRDVVRFTPGAVLVVDGERVECPPSTGEPSRRVRGASPLCALLEGWEPVRERFGEPGFGEFLLANQHLLPLAASDAWTGGREPDDALAVTGEEVRDGGSRDVIAQAEPVTDIEALRYRLSKTALPPYAISMSLQAAEAALGGRDDTSFALVTDADRQPIGVATMMRMVGVRELSERHAHVAYTVMATATALRPPPALEWAHGAAAFLREQVLADLDVLGAALSLHAGKVTVDVAALMVDRGADPVDILLDDGVGVGAEMFFDLGPDNVVEGQTRLVRQDAATFTEARRRAGF